MPTAPRMIEKVQNLAHFVVKLLALLARGPTRNPLLEFGLEAAEAGERLNSSVPNHSS